MILEIEEIQSRLDEQFLPLEPMLTGFRLVSSPVEYEDVGRLSHQLDVVLPDDFKGMLQEFNFGEFTIGPIAFCNSGDYLSWTIENNRKDLVNQWWGSGPRPNNLLLVANSDPYAVLLNTVTGAVNTFKHGESWEDDAIVVADDFRKFIRGLGSVFLQRDDQGGNVSLADEVSSEVGGGNSNVFWRWLAE